MNNTKEFNEMLKQTIDFYNGLGIKIKKGNERIAVSSLTMSGYANNYKDKFHRTIYSNNALSTLGDGICLAYVMYKKYHLSVSSEVMTNAKELLTNVNLQDKGKKLLENHLFFENTDLDGNKSYATAFEAVIGFIALNNYNDVSKVFDKYIEL